VKALDCMSKKITERFFSFSKQIFFEEFGTKFPAGSFKNIMDLLFVLFEKISINFPILARNYVDMYREVVLEEISMANISSTDTILVIGSGSIPSTPIILAREINAKIQAIDYDLGAVKRATAYIKNQGLTDNINIIYGDGLNYPTKNFNVIFILYGVKNQQKILEYISKNITKDTRVIYRSAKDIKSIEREDNISLSKLFLIKDNVKTMCFGSLESFLLTKK